MTQFTNSVGSTPNPVPTDPSVAANANGGVPPGYVKVTVAPNQRLTLSVNGAIYVYYAGSTVVIPADEYTYLWRDGVVVALSPNQIAGVNVL